MKTILCPTDFSVNAECAVNYGASMAEALNAKLLIVHIFLPPVMNAEAQVTFMDEITSQLREDADKKLKSLQSKLLKQYPKLLVSLIVEEGLPHTKIVEVAIDNEADLIVMGATGTTKLGRILVGSTATRVIRHARCPVLCIPINKRFEGIKKIVFATDLHEDNITSAKQICAFAGYFNAEIIFLFVDDKHIIPGDKEVEEMTGKIHACVKYPKLSGYISGNKNVLKGIGLFLEKYPADLLVMFSHGKDFPQTLFHASVTTLMSHQASIPLLALKHSTKPLLKESML